MKIRLVDRKTAAKKIVLTIILVVALLVIINYYLNPLVEEQLKNAAARIAGSQHYNEEKVLEALTATITRITGNLVYAYIIVVVARTIIGLIDHKLLNLTATRTLTLAYLAYTYIALNQGKITLSLGENTVVIDVSRLLTTTLTSIALIVVGVTTIQAANILRRTRTEAEISREKKVNLEI